MRRLALCLALLLPTGTSLSGCSWLFVQPLPDNHRSGDFINCTNSRAAPVVDTILTLTNVGSAVYVAGEDNVSNKGAAVTAGLLVGALWLSSAIYGYSKTADCVAAMEDAEPPPRYRQPRMRLPPPPPPPVGGAPPPDSSAPSVVPAPTAPAPGGPVQQQDDDDPSSGSQPRPRPAPSQPKPDAPRFGG